MERRNRHTRLEEPEPNDILVRVRIVRGTKGHRIAGGIMILALVDAMRIYEDLLGHDVFGK